MNCHRNHLSITNAEDNDSLVFTKDISGVINSLPDGYRIVKMVKASRGAGQFIYMTDKSDEELREIARQNILASRNRNSRKC